ncbi:tetratricopeptide (TPR) repeat protein [Thermocatellispora tengchongensis]|uniref:Tetratricopeptide (TPR) repeat protein n=1 Tax=Thermocatellispora tengchongensis TaxID=1073253 RepID=A0A840NX50_9ACTN|nr:tetratricopeptide repeat protein [Thermocatellispora tengchongensis]MBB5133414.1 tetratricopeptide (TPR) repeat protein [Thermocatellispora tengchongensis]
MLDIPASVMRLRAMGAAAGALAERGELDRAAGVMDRALEAARAVAGPRERIRCLIAVAAGMAAVCPLEQALRVAYAIERVDDRIGALGAVAAALAGAGRTARAAEVLAQISDAEPDPAARRALTGALVAAGELDRAAAVAGGDPEPSWAWDALVPALVRAGRLEHARAAALLLVTNPLRRDLVLLEVAEALAEDGQAERALEVAGHIDAPSTRTQALLTAAAAFGDPARRAAVLRRATAAAQAIPNYGARTTKLQSLAVAWAEHGALDRALAVAESIERDPGRSEARVSLARLLIRQGRPEQAAAVLGDAPVLTAADPNPDLLASVASTMAEAGRLDRAVAIARGIAGRSRREEALRRVATAMAGAGHHERAGEVLDEIAAGLPATGGEDDIHHVYGWAGLADAMVRAGLADRAGEPLRHAESLIHTLYDEEERAEAWRLLQGALVRAGRFERAAVVARERGTQARLVRALCDAGRPDLALDVAESVPDPDLHGWARRRVATEWARAGRLDEAEALARAVEPAPSRCEALVAVAGARARAGHLDRAVELLRLAETAAASVPDPRERAGRQREVVETLMTAGRLDRAAELLRQAENEANAETGTNAETEVNADTGDDASAGLLAEVLVAAGRLDRALTVALEIGDPLEQCHALAAVAEAYAARPRPRRDPLLYPEAVSSSVRDPEVRTRIWARAARARAVTGDAVRAGRLLDQVFAGGDPAPGPAAVAAAEALAAAGRHDRALELAATYADPRTGAAITAVVASALAHAGDLDRAGETARSIADPEAREWALAAVSYALARAGEPERALSMLFP